MTKVYCTVAPMFRNKLQMWNSFVKKQVLKFLPSFLLISVMISLLKGT